MTHSATSYTPWKMASINPLDALLRNALYTRQQPWPVMLAHVPCALTVPLVQAPSALHKGDSHEQNNTKPLFANAFCLIMRVGNEQWLLEVGENIPLALHPALASVRDQRLLPIELQSAVLELLAAPLAASFAHFMDMPVQCEVLTHTEEDQNRAQAIREQAVCTLPLNLTTPCFAMTDAAHGESPSESHGQQNIVPLLLSIQGQDSAGLLYQKVQALPPQLHDISALSVSVGIEAGRMELSTTELAGLQLDDVLLPASYPALDGRITLNTPQATIPCTLQHGMATVETIISVRQNGQSISQGEALVSEEQNTQSGEHQAIPNVAELDVTLTFELDQRTMTIGELSALAPGYTFALGVDAMAPVTLRIGDKAIGTGRLVDLGETIGVQVFSLVDMGKAEKAITTMAPKGLFDAEDMAGDSEPVRDLSSFSLKDTPTGSGSGGYA